MGKNKKYWIIQRHTSNMNLLFAVAKYLINEYGKTIDKTKIQEILFFFKKINYIILETKKYQVLLYQLK